MTQPFVSIVVPTYDRAGFVEMAIDSILDQDYPALEVIVVDDGSHDETPVVLARIGARTDPERFRWLRHENVGQATSINRGYEEARGELLGYLSSDDYLLPGAISRLVEVAEEHPEADIFYPWNLYVDGADQYLDTFETLSHTFVDAVRWAFCMPGVGALVRRRLVDRIGGWDPRYGITPDYEWWVRAGEAIFVRVPETLAVNRGHEDTITKTKMHDTAHIRERFRILDELFARDDLPAAVRAVRREAYSTLMIMSALLIEPPSDVNGRVRFAIEDWLVPRVSPVAREVIRGHNLALTRELHAAQHHIARLGAVIDLLNHTIDVHRDAANRREERIARLERSPKIDAMWRRTARRITPAPVRRAFRRVVPARGFPQPF